MNPHRSRSASLAYLLNPRRLALVAVAWLMVPFATAAEPSRSFLHLANGGYVEGVWQDSAEPGIVRWQPSSFAAPFHFPVNTVNAIHFRQPAEPPKPAGDFCFELAGGDVVFGALVALDDKEAVLDIPRYGRLHVERSRLLRMERASGNADLIYLGPNGLTGWHAPTPKNGWREEAGQLVSNLAGATIAGNLGLPARAVIDLEISWKEKPDFTLMLGVGDDDSSFQHAFQFTVDDDELIVRRETDEEADVALIGAVHAADRVRLRVFLDQPKGRLLVCTPSGKPLTALKVAEPKPEVFPGIALVNREGTVRLERLRISRWNTEPPRESQADATGIQRADGAFVTGEIVRFDDAAHEFIVRAANGETRVPQGQFAGLTLSLPTDDTLQGVRAVAQDGSRLSGTLTKVEKGELWLSVAGVKEPLRLSVATLRSFVVLDHERTPVAYQEETGRLEIEGVRLRGKLTDARAADGASCLAWQPFGSVNASPIRSGVSGKIVYREPPKTTMDSVQAAQLRAAQRQLQLPGGVAPAAQNAAQLRAAEQRQLKLQLQRAAAQPVAPQVQPPQPAPPQPAPPRPLTAQKRAAQPVEPPAPAPPAPAPPPAPVQMQPFVVINNGVRSTHVRAMLPRKPLSLYLRSGDNLPSEVTKIDEKGVWFQSSLSEGKFVPHDKVKAVELAFASAMLLDKAQRERLLTLPRMQKESPPTHLIRSVAGDYLRGRLLSMDDKTLRIEVRLETKEVPRDRVARIIWLHPEDLEKSPNAEPPPEAGATTRVQAVCNNGIRLTFLAEQVADGALSGKSDVIGSCRVKLSDVDQIEIGEAIEQEAAQLAYQRWKLQNAPEPKVLQDDGGGSSGTDSLLVGKPAPDFALELLGGKTFRLAESKGKVVVLDFWATWCGPCMQAMPQVDRVTREFPEQDLQLIAVNLQETPKQITDMLERHKLRLTVALDRDGVVAEKYAAHAIPQTVIIDRDGNVARLFVGGGPHFDDQLRDALRTLLPESKK